MARPTKPEIPSPLVITQVANGYVAEAWEPRRDFAAPAREQSHVFQSFAELAKHLDEHFDHREGFIEADE